MVGDGAEGGVGAQTLALAVAAEWMNAAAVEKDGDQ